MDDGWMMDDDGWMKTINPVLSYIKPQITPPSPLKVETRHGGSLWRIYLADSAPPRGKPARKTRRKTGRWGRGDAMHLAWLGSFSQRDNGYSFLMISPNLLDIWPVFFLILSRYETSHFLIIFRPSGDGYSLLGSKK